MTPREAKRIAAQYSYVLDFWFDHNAGMRLWTITDRMLDGETDYIAPGWLREFSEEQLHETFEYCAKQYAELRDIKILMPRRAVQIAKEHGVDLVYKSAWHFGKGDKIGRGSRIVMTMTEDAFLEALRALDFCAGCGDAILGRSEYKKMPSRGEKHPPLFAPHHPDCESLATIQGEQS